MKSITVFLLLSQGLLYAKSMSPPKPSSSGSMKASLPCGLKKPEIPKDTSKLDPKMLKCLCDMKLKSSGSAKVGKAEISGGIDLSKLECSGKVSKPAQKGSTYKVKVHRDWIYGHPNDMVNISDNGYKKEDTIKYLKGMKGSDSLQFTEGKMHYGLPSGKPFYLVKADGKSLKNICQKDFKKNSNEYNFLKIVKAFLLDGKDCPVKKGTITTAKTEIDMELVFLEKLPCDKTVSISLTMSPKEGDTRTYALGSSFGFWVQPDSDCKKQEKKQ